MERTHRDPAREYHAYYDASGSESDLDRPLIVVGLLAAGVQWRAFDRAWTDALRQFDLPYFHMAEYAGSRGPFTGWSTERRTAFLETLIPILGRNVAHGIAFRVVPRDFHAVNSDYHLATELCPSPYPFVAYRCISLLENWLWSRDPDALLVHAIEAGDVGQGVIADLVQREQVHLRIVPAQDAATAEYITPFQAADLVAYETCLYVHRRRQGSDRAPRKSLTALAARLPIDASKMEQRELRQLCESHPDRFPRRGTPAP